MICRLTIAFGIAALACGLIAPLHAQQAATTGGDTVTGATPSQPATAPAKEPATKPTVAPPAAPEAIALKKALASLTPGENDEERNERTAIASFYEARGYAPLWLTPAGGYTPNASMLVDEINRADEWGLSPNDFPLPPLATTPATGPEAIATAEIDVSLTILKYGRYARGGRIINPSEQLSSHLDRRPQLFKPIAILEGIAATGQPDIYLRGLHPAHPQFEKLRQKYLALIKHGNQTTNSKKTKGTPGTSAAAKRLLANMEEWRWMPADLGDLYVWNNIPDFTQRVIRNGQVIRKERIVAGEIGKQTSIFSRPLRKVTFKPTWIVPDSIKARELWPSLLKGGGLMREWDLEVRTKEGQPVDWQRINWANTDILKYDVIQLNGPKSVMGKVKFTFPSQHTVFMHDTMERDKYMFKQAQRTFSHGCMRVANPIGLAEVLLEEDKGWGPAQVREILRNGPLNNEIAIDRKIPVHITYFTALVDDNGKLQTFPDVYGHERRITQALEGKWDQIVKGRDHLAPVEVNLADATRLRVAKDDTGSLPRSHHAKRDSGGSLFDNIFGR
jgi:L,D-transpeptidase YcbB